MIPPSSSSPLPPKCARISSCEVCGTALPEHSLDLGEQPLCDDLVPISEERDVLKYPTQISLCRKCFTAHHLYPVKKELLFPDSYHYRARFTQDVLIGMRGLVDECDTFAGGVRHKRVCDIGCNDGSLLSFFRERGAATAGIEPTGAAADATASGHTVIKEYFGRDSARKLVRTWGCPDLITFTNVFAHIESLAETIDGLREMLKPTTHLVIENHYLGSVLASNQFDTFYHEHPRTYSLQSFLHIARRLGGEVVHVSFPGRYGGNIRVYISNFSRQPITAPADAVQQVDERDFPERLNRMQAFIQTWREDTRSRLAELRASGLRSVCGKSFPARASILINLLELKQEFHPMVFEKPGSKKIGHYIPGTRAVITSDQEWIGQAVQPEGIIVWAWHIFPEIEKYLRENGYRGRLFRPLPTFAEVK